MVVMLCRSIQCQAEELCDADPQLGKTDRQFSSEIPAVPSGRRIHYFRQLISKLPFKTDSQKLQKQTSLRCPCLYFDKDFLTTIFIVCCFPYLQPISNSVIQSTAFKKCSNTWRTILVLLVWVFFFTNILEHQIARAFLCKHFNVEIVGWVCH